MRSLLWLRDNDGDRRSRGCHILNRGGRIHEEQIWLSRRARIPLEELRLRLGCGLRSRCLNRQWRAGNGLRGHLCHRSRGWHLDRSRCWRGGNGCLYDRLRSMTILAVLIVNRLSGRHRLWLGLRSNVSFSTGTSTAGMAGSDSTGAERSVRPSTESGDISCTLSELTSVTEIMSPSLALRPGRT